MKFFEEFWRDQKPKEYFRGINVGISRGPFTYLKKIIDGMVTTLPTKLYLGFWVRSPYFPP